MADYFEDPRRSRWRNIGLAAVFLVAALFLYFLPQHYQTPIRRVIRSTALTPFIWAQGAMVSQNARAAAMRELRAERDSLLAVVAAQASLAEENRQLREILGLRNRAPASFVPAELVRVGTPGGESSFLLDVGREDGVVVGSPVIASGGLLGVVWEVGATSSQAIDWTHADFRASAMTGDGEAYGIIESRRGLYREEDRLALTGAPFHTDVAPGTRVVTSGRGGVYPRGILVGTVVSVEDAEPGWRKSYVVRPAVRPESATHVLVGTQGEGALEPLWSAGGEPSPEQRP
ncbi:MAG: rod shape-determining protein MreC [Longimicrobiales bacterium]